MGDTKINNKPLKIAVGTDNFKKMATEYDVFVDKTLFIKEIIDSSEEAILITHPRRWGKTLNLDMLKTFFEPESEECKKSLEDKYHNIKPEKQTWGEWFSNFITFNDASKTEDTIGKVSPQLLCNKDIFAGGKFTISLGNERSLESLKISSALDNRGNKIIDTYQGRYPVIFISLKDVVGDTIEKIESKLKGLISTTYESYSYLANSSKILGSEKLKFQHYIDQDYTGITIEESIKFLSALLYKHHGQRVYVLVDEYDKPVNSLLEKYLGQGKSSEKVSLIQDVTKLISYTVCSSVGKTNHALEKLIMMGIFDTTQKESGSGCNNVSVYGITDIKFSKSFGFSKIETDALIYKLKFSNTEVISNNIKSWYNGYYVPVSTEEKLALYTPWAIMKYLNIAYDTGEYIPENYWADSGSSTIFKNLYIEEVCSNTELSRKLQSIVMGEAIELNLNRKISLYKYYVENTGNKESLFSYMLLNSGYLTIDERHLATNKLFIAPNLEVKSEFEKIARDQREVNCKNHQEILANIRKNEHTDIFKSIKEHNIEKIKEVFMANPAITCNEKDLNFSYLHVAGIIGNKDIFSFLAQRCYKNLYEDDKTFGLKPFDYAYLAGKEIELMNSFYIKTKETISKPETLTKIVCFFDNLPVIGSLLDLTVGIKNKNFSLKSKVSDISDRKNSVSECEKYDAILTDTPAAFIHLIQFEKYKAEYPDKIYIKLDSECEKGDKELKKLDAAVFDKSEEFFSFYLCEEGIKEDL